MPQSSFPVAQPPYISPVAQPPFPAPKNNGTLEPPSESQPTKEATTEQKSEFILFRFSYQSVKCMFIILSNKNYYLKHFAEKSSWKLKLILGTVSLKPTYKRLYSYSQVHNT